MTFTLVTLQRRKSVSTWLLFFNLFPTKYVKFQLTHYKSVKLVYSLKRSVWLPHPSFRGMLECLAHPSWDMHLIPGKVRIFNRGENKNACLCTSRQLLSQSSFNFSSKKPSLPHQLSVQCSNGRILFKHLILVVLPSIAILQEKRLLLNSHHPVQLLQSYKIKDFF